MFASQSIAKNAFSAFGDAVANNSRPSVDYVKAGDIIRVLVAYNADWYFGGSDIGAKFTANLQQAFNVRTAPYQVQSYQWIVEVQPRSDYAHLNDVLSVVLNAAQNAGLSVNTATSYAQFVSQVETAGTAPPATIPPKPSSNNSSGKGLEDYLNDLTRSPTTLAVILGAAVILVIAAKGR